MKILLVEDDPSTLELLAFHLTAARYTVEQTTDGVTALELASLWEYDLIVLDVQIPRLDGISVCRQLRAQGMAAPILILTAQSDDDDVITGLDTGADDYVTKPFEISRVLARVRALLRRGVTATAIPSLAWGDLCLNPVLAQVTYGDQVVPVTPKEYSLLELFLRYPQRVFSRSTILDHLWTIDDSPTEGAVTNLVKDLRNRLKRSGVSKNIIQTVYGLGYRLKEAPAETGGETTPPQEARSMDWPSGLGGSQSTLWPTSPDERIDSLPSLPDPAGAAATNSIAAIAARFQTSLKQRLGVIEDATRVLQAGALPPQQREIARDEAHRLAGGLGTFGYEEGSRQAKQIEAILSSDQPMDQATIARLSGGLLALKQTLATPPSSLDGAETVMAKPHYRGMAITLGLDCLGQLQPAGLARGWQLEAVSTWAELEQKLGTQSLGKTVDALVLALEDNVPLAVKLAPLRDLKRGYPDLPVLVLTSHDSLEERVQVVRLGGDRYLVAPVTSDQILETLDQLLPHTQAPESRVMVVDDDPTTRHSIAQMLTPWGLRVTELGYPSQFWEVFRQTQPDLLLLALDMPTFSGVDLCRVVRQDARYGDLPILMVAGQSDTATVRQVFEVGGDDLISKPIVGPELVTRVLSRIERSRLRQQLDQMCQQQSGAWPQPDNIDPLTQIANSRHFAAFLQQQWERHRQNSAPIAAILCSLDEFADYTTKYGPTTGDLLLRRLAQTLQQTINLNIDLVARYSPAGFGLVLPNTNLDEALRVVARIQRAGSQIKLSEASFQEKVSISLSLGVSGTVPTKTLSSDHLLKTAEQALNAAKARGGNTFCLYPI